jgi:hypothetical protein
VGTIVLHFGQMVSVLGRFASCDRRFPVRELECFRFGTAIGNDLGYGGRLLETAETTYLFANRQVTTNPRCYATRRELSTSQARELRFRRKAAAK